MEHNGKPVKITYLPFPVEVQGSIPGFLMECKTCYKIGIDITQPLQRQRHALAHELAHLYLDHLNQHDRPVMEQEAEAHRQAWHFYRKWKQEQHPAPEELPHRQ